MRAYTLTGLVMLRGDGREPTDVNDTEIIDWVNSKLESGNKSSRIASFKDPSIAVGVVVLDLVDAIKSGSVKYDLVKAGGTKQVRSHVFKLHCHCTLFRHISLLHSFLSWFFLCHFR